MDLVEALLSDTQLSEMPNGNTISVTRPLSLQAANTLSTFRTGVANAIRALNAHNVPLALSILRGL